MYIDPSGFIYNEFYLFSEKAYEMVPSGTASYDLKYATRQNAPVIVTSSGYITSNSSDPWGQTNGLGKYDKVGFGDFTYLSDGSIDTSKKEFSLHPYSSGTIVFNHPSGVTENVFVEYEAGPSGYYIWKDLDLNPIRNEIDSGFIQFSSPKDPGDIYLSSSKNSLNTDGWDFCRLVATLYDTNYNKSYGKDVIFSIPDYSLGYLTPINGSVYATASGYTIGVKETTDRRGVARAMYTPLSGKSGTQIITAYYENNFLVSDLVSIEQTGALSASASGFMLDESLLDYIDYLYA